MTEFVVWSRRLANNDYLAQFYENYMRIKLYGATKRDGDFINFLKSIPRDVSCIPYKSRNSDEYFLQCPTEKMLLGDFSICEKAAAEYIECAELCATTEYYMTFCQRKNGVFVPDEAFDQIQKRAYRAGVSKIPYDTKRSEEYSKNISFLLSPIAFFS